MPERTTSPAFSHAEFRRSIRGQKATLPNFYSLFPDWKPNLHPEYERARDEVLNPWLERWIPNPTTVRNFQKAEFGVFAAVMCARTSFEKLCTVCKAFAWYFIWDDCMRDPVKPRALFSASMIYALTSQVFDCGSLATDNEAASAYRKKSMHYLCAVLCNQKPMPDLSGLSEELQNALHCWDEVAAHLRQECSQGSLLLNAVYKTLMIFLEQNLFYISSVDTVDMLFRENHVPSLTEYWIRREQTAGVYPVIATIPFIYGIDITHKDIDADLMQSLWRHTSYLVHVINDMFSLRKEIADDQIENIVTVIMLNDGVDCNQAMRLSHHFVQEEAAHGFQKVERRLRAQSFVVSTERSMEDAFIEGCRNVVMGLTHWSYSGQRYFRQSELNERHEVDFHI